MPSKLPIIKLDNGEKEIVSSIKGYTKENNIHKRTT